MQDMSKELRERADSLNQKLATARSATDNSDLSLQQLLHELSVHQIELEMQNDALRTTQSELQASENKFYRIYHHSPVGNLTLDASGVILQCNQRFIELVERDDLRILGRTLSEFVAPHDRLQFNQWMKSKDRQTRKPYIQFASSKKTLKHVQMSLAEISSNHGEDLTVVACVDVTDLREAEANARLAGAVFQTTSEAIMVMDAEYRTIMVNPAFERLTGYRTEEMLGKNASILKSGHHDKAFYEGFWHEVNEKGHWEGEFWNQRKNGTVYAEWKTVNVVKDHLGQPVYYIGVSTDMSARKEMESVIRLQATHDALTHLPNRLLFMDRLQQGMRLAKRTDDSLHLLFLDLDGFKDVNDTLGHDHGDELLVEVSARLRGCVRETDTVARLGGDEFAVVLVGISNDEALRVLVENILTAIARSYTVQNERVFVTASIGITSFPADAQNSESLLKNADQAMYNAKKNGKNCYRFFTPELQQKLDTRQQISNDLRASDVESEFVLHYQPIFRLSDGLLHKAEALVRWQHPTRGMISPAQFIPVAEETGMIREIGGWVFRQATADVARWRRLFTPDMQVSVNKSPAQFREDQLPMNDWVEHMRGLGLPGDSLVVEITEGLLLEFTDYTQQTLRIYQDSGMEISLDDFGTGYSSLSYIKKLNINYLKIDQSFVAHLGVDDESAALCEAIILMAHKLGLKVVAEGIETEAQRDFLRAAHCDYGQGYLLGRPMPRDELETRHLAACRAASA